MISIATDNIHKGKKGSYIPTWQSAQVRTLTEVIGMEENLRSSRIPST